MVTSQPPEETLGLSSPALAPLTRVLSCSPSFLGERNGRIGDKGSEEIIGIPCSFARYLPAGETLARFRRSPGIFMDGALSLPHDTNIHS